jgi:hypothetical protein
MDEVDSIEGEIVSAEDLTMDRWWGSEALDLDHLRGDHGILRLPG